MESLIIVWRFFLLASLFLLPQLLGVLFVFRLSRFPGWLARVLAALTPAVLFFYLAQPFFFAGLREAQLKGEITCGMPAVAAGFMFLLGIAVHLLAGLTVQLFLFRRQSGF